MNLLPFAIVCFTGILADDRYKVPNWKFHFLPGSGMGLFVAVALPLDLPNKNAYMAYNFEANYPLPGNDTSYEYPPLVQRGIGRQLIYTALETKMESNGYPGRNCLLRIICESAMHPMKHGSGVLGDILHIMFTPSTSTNEEDFSSDYVEAEKYGRKQQKCTKYNKKCSSSFLDFISWVGDAV